MLIRVFQVTTRPGKEEEFCSFFHDTAIPLMKRTEGLHSITFGTARAESPRDFCMVMVWENLAALKAFAGEDYENLHILPEEAAMVKSRDIRHYDLVAT